MIDTELERDVGLKMAKENDIFCRGIFQKNQRMRSHFYQVVKTIETEVLERAIFLLVFDSISRFPIIPLRIPFNN